MLKPIFAWLLSSVLLTSLFAGCSPDKPGNQTGSAAHTEIVWLTDYDVALTLARSTNKLVVVDFFATWCGPCRMMERDTFSDKNVQQQLANFVPLKIDVDRQPQLAAKYGIECMPTTLVIDATGKQLYGAVGYLEPDSYLAVLDKARTSSTTIKDVVK